MIFGSQVEKQRKADLERERRDIRTPNALRWALNIPGYPYPGQATDGPEAIELLRAHILKIHRNNEDLGSLSVVHVSSLGSDCGEGSQSMPWRGSGDVTFS